MRQRNRFVLIAETWLIIIVVSHASARGDNWPQFRGPTGQGLCAEKNLPTTWGGESRTNVVWQSPLIGEGHASPIVWNNHLFVCTARWPDDAADKAQIIPEHHLLCYETSSGQLAWDTIIAPGPWTRSDFRSGAGGGYAAPTPATDGDHIFCAFGSSVLAAVAGKSFVIEAGREYKMKATNDLGDPNHASPAISGGRIFLVGTKSIYCVGTAE